MNIKTLFKFIIISLLGFIFYNFVQIESKPDNNIKLIIKSNKNSYLIGESIWIEQESDVSEKNLLDNPSQNFKMDISLNKNVFYEGEEVWLTVKVKNLNNKTDSLPFLNENELGKMMIVEDENGEISRYKGDINMYIRKPFTKFSPYEEKIYIIGLLNIQGFVSEVERNRSFIHIFIKRYYFPQGNYQVQCFTIDYSENIEYLKSDKLKFQVIVPFGDENENLIELRKIYRLEEKRKEDKKLKIETYREFLKKTRNSVYYEQTFNNYLNAKYFSKIQYDSTVIDECLDFLNHNPNSFYAYEIVFAITDALLKFKGDKELAIHTLEEIKRKYPNTLISKEAEKLLKDNLNKFIIKNK